MFQLQRLTEPVCCWRIIGGTAGGGPGGAGCRGPARASTRSRRRACCESPCWRTRRGWWRTPRAPATTGPGRPGCCPKNTPSGSASSWSRCWFRMKPRSRCWRRTRWTSPSRALAETPDRDPVVDFVMYSNTSVCMFGRADNPKFAAANTVDDLNKSGHHHRVFHRRRRGGMGEAAVPEGEVSWCGEFRGHRAAGGYHGEARRRGADQSHSVGADGRKVKGLAVLPKDEQLPGQHGEGAAGRHGDRQEAAGVPGMGCARWRQTVHPKLEADGAAGGGTMK